MAHSGRRTGYTIWPASRYAFTNKQGPRKCGPCSFLRGRATLHPVITYQCSARRLGEPSVGTPTEIMRQAAGLPPAAFISRDYRSGQFGL
jgi:hypothetical protein